MKTKVTLQCDIDKLEEARILLHEMAGVYGIPINEVLLITEPMWKVINRIVKQEN